MASKDSHIRSISKALAVLQVINRHGSSTTTEIAREIDIPYPTACRIIKTLADCGVIEREPTRKRYRPTALSQSLSCGYQRSNQLIAIARPHIIDLTRETTWPVSLATRVGAYMVVQDATNGFTTQTFYEYYPGYTFPLTGSAAGLVYLAYCSEQTRKDLLSQLSAGKNSTSSGSSNLLYNFHDEVFHSIRVNGYATFVRNQYSRNPGKTSSIAVPLCVGEKLVGAFALVYFASAFDTKTAVEHYLDDIKRTQERINSDLRASAEQFLSDQPLEFAD